MSHDDQDFPHQPSAHRYQRGMTKLPQEIEEGNVEYKRTVSNIPPNKYHRLLTQMEWRLSEGGGVCVYYLGVDDDGTFVGLSARDQDSSLETLGNSAQESGASITGVHIIYPSKEAFCHEPIKDEDRTLHSSCNPDSPTHIKDGMVTGLTRKEKKQRRKKRRHRGHRLVTKDECPAIMEVIIRKDKTDIVTFWF